MFTDTKETAYKSTKQKPQLFSQILLSMLQEKPKDENPENKTLTLHTELQNYLDQKSEISGFI